MKLKHLLLFLLISSSLFAQEAYRNLVITEARMVVGDFNNSYLEITNMGDVPIDLKEIKIAKGFPQVVDLHDYSTWSADSYYYLPENVTKVLQPGESYVMTIGLDFELNMYNARIPGYGFGNRSKNHDIYKYADFIAHREEKNEIELGLYPNIKDSAIYSPDSVITNTAYVFTIGHLHLLNKGLWLEHHFADGDSAVIDQIKNMFDGENGRNSSTAWDIAGVTEATRNAVLVRKSIIKTGNLDFNNSRGVGLNDSEWLPLIPPAGEDNWRDIWWTVGNHGDFVLDANTLTPETPGFIVDFNAKTITVPWGTRRLDDIMRNMKYTPGVAWTYHLNESVEDSLLRSAQTGDKLIIYVVGQSLYAQTFDILVSEPTADVNMVVPVDHRNMEEGPITNNTQNGILGWPRVSKNKNGIDTITGGGYGLPFALRVDSLYKYLEKPAEATWEILYVDGQKRADLKTGDKLKVVAKNGAIKEYYIETQGYVSSHNANLASITWPDINLDGFYRDIFGWKGDTIPGFTPGTQNYRLKLPSDHEGIPALIAKAEDLNASIVLKRATSLKGTVEDRTTIFEVQAEDDSVKKIYTVELIKEKDFNYIQPYFAEPFVSEMVIKTNGNNNFIEICNPGNQPLDLGNYMFVAKNSIDPVDAITTSSGVGDWNNRYERYIPGYKWVSNLDWQVTPAMLIPDISVPRIVQPGDVFCFGTINNDNHIPEGTTWPIPKELDVQFWNNDLTYGSYSNPWGEEVGEAPVPNTFTEEFFVFKIINDSILSGLKAVGDPNDFELVEIYGMTSGGRIQVAGISVTQRAQWVRKPEFFVGNTVLESSFGTNEDDSEWIARNAGWYGARGIGQTEAVAIMESDLGKHFFYEPTQYMSTVNAVVYKVSPGYSMNEKIEGIITGTTATEFLANIFKANEGQTLTVKSVVDGSELASDALLSLNDTLVVVSADQTNTSKYVLSVAEIGLSSDAVLTSNRFDVTIISEPKSAIETAEAGKGKVSGFEYGTQLKTIVDNINVPKDAVLTIIDANGAFVSLRTLNFDTSYVFVTVNSNMYFDVLAEDGKTKIIYQLTPQVSQSAAFITSDVYSVDQKNMLIEFIPRGTVVQTFLSNVVPSLGATIKLVDKFGLERTEGNIVQDDKLVVTSPNGAITKVYYLSMLRTVFVPSTTYLAYITSSRYGIDQINYVINGVNGSTLVSDFYSRIVPSMGASAILVDANGNEKTAGDIDGGDMVKVTSVDGKITVMYSFGYLTRLDNTELSQIQLYPNPTSAIMNISGVQKGNLIQVFNATGNLVLQKETNKNIESIALNQHPAGIYLIVVSNENRLLGRFKVLRK